VLEGHSEEWEGDKYYQQELKQPVVKVENNLRSRKVSNLGEGYIRNIGEEDDTLHKV